MVGGYALRYALEDDSVKLSCYRATEAQHFTSEAREVSTLTSPTVNTSSALSGQGRGSLLSGHVYWSGLDAELRKLP